MRKTLDTTRPYHRGHLVRRVHNAFACTTSNDPRDVV
jgi:hypothetical protein